MAARRSSTVVLVVLSISHTQQLTELPAEKKTRSPGLDKKNEEARGYSNNKSHQVCFFGWSQLSRVEHGQAGPGRPRLARPVIYSNHGPKPAQSARFQSHRPSDKPGTNKRDSISQAVCPARPIFSRLFVFGLWLILLKFRGHNVLVSPCPAVCSGNRPSFTSAVRSRVYHAPKTAFGYRWCAWFAWCCYEA